MSETVKNQIDQLMEEASEAEAQAFSIAERDVHAKDSHAKSILIDIERERRGHEGLLKGMRQNV
jgi:hypothetical protein